MNLQKAEKLARQKMDEHGFEGWAFKWSNAKNIFGLCSFSKRTIKLSRLLVELNTEERVLNTILHEIAHAIAGWEAKHGPRWKAVCRRIGAKPERCFTRVDTEVPKSKYLLVCPGCEDSQPRHRKLTGKRFACVACCNKHNRGRFSEEYAYKLYPTEQYLANKVKGLK